MKKLIVILSLVITACAPTTQFPDVNKDLAEKEAEIQRDIALTETHKHFTRLQDISAPLFTANADICPKNKVKPFYGLHASSVEAFDEKFQKSANRVHGLQSYPTIYHISPSTPAHGKFQSGDVIKRVDDKVLSEGKKSNKELFEYIYDEDRLDQEMVFVIERDGTDYSVNLTPVAACGGQVILSDQPSVNAFADGKNVLVTRQMMKMANDNELALVVGHEIAHNSRKHIEAKRGNAMIGLVFGTAISVATGVNISNLGSNLGASAFSQDFEAEADYVGLYHAARAGYDIDEAPYFWRRMAAENPAGIDAVGGSHPADSHRFVALEATVKEINAKRAAGQPLIAEEKKIDQVKKESDYN